MRNRKGVAAVEMALVSPLFVFLILAMVEVGNGVRVAQIVTSAAREGARVVAASPGPVVPPWHYAPGTREAGVELAQYQLDKAGIKAVSTVIFEDTYEAGEVVATVVKVSVPAKDVSIFPPFFLKNTITSSCVFRTEKLR